MRRLRPALISRPLALPNRHAEPPDVWRQRGGPRSAWRCPACLSFLRSHRKRSGSHAIQGWCGSATGRGLFAPPHRRRRIPQRRDAEMSCRRTAVGGAAKRRRIAGHSERSTPRACPAAGLSRQRARSEGSDPKGATGRFSAAAGSPLLLRFVCAALRRRPSRSAPAPVRKRREIGRVARALSRESVGKTPSLPGRASKLRSSAGQGGSRVPPSPRARHHSTDISDQKMGSASLPLRLLVLLACRNRIGFYSRKKIALDWGVSADRI